MGSTHRFTAQTPYLICDSGAKPPICVYLCLPGVWPEGSDGTDINALIRSHNRKVIALADDFCKVHLFQYPCARPKVSKPCP